MAEQIPWWQKTTIYQIYPRSFMDSNGDGIGDLQGIISKLDYLQDLGFETIWISPFFASPQADWGYDISDYLSIAPEYGQMGNVEQLIIEVHRRQMRVLFDLVLNHTSDQHPWFESSRTSKDDPRRDWYIWRDGKGSRPPNNWRSIVGGSAWHFDAQTKQWFYASFLPFQPDLNYRNPEVVSQMMAVAKYWLDMGVDGFRLDIFHSLFKDEEFRDNPWSTKLFSRDYPAGFFQDFLYNFNQPETFEFACQLRQLADSYLSPKLLLGEIFADTSTSKKYLGQDTPGLNLVFLWNLLNVRPEAAYLRDILAQNEINYSPPFSPVLVYGNHDHQRMMSRIRKDDRLASLLAVFQFTARGVPVTYYGEEIGMSELFLPKDEWIDPVGMRFSWLPGFIPKAMKINPTRDGCRSPMQWNPGENAGFTSPGIKPWLPLNEDIQQVNVSTQLEQPGSLLNTYRQLLQIRTAHPALQAGKLEIFASEKPNSQLLAFTRIYEAQQVLVLLNFGRTPISFVNHTGCQQIAFKVGDINQDRDGNIVVGAYASAIITN